MCLDIVLMCRVIFVLMTPKEFINQSWSKKDKERKAPNILGFIGRFNFVSRWVASCVVMVLLKFSRGADSSRRRT